MRHESTARGTNGRPWSRASVLAVMFLAAIASRLALADQPVALVANYTQLARLAPGTTSGQLTFSVDRKAKTLMIDIASTVATLATSIEAPGNRVVNETNVGTFGGVFAKVDGSSPSGPLIYPFSTAGMHYIYRLPSLGEGNYVVKFQAAAPLAEQAPVIVQITSDSPIAAQLLFTEPRVVTGRPTVVAAAVFDGPAKVANATVKVSVLSATGIAAMLDLADDGSQADGAAGDGIYSSFFTPSAPGSYRAVAEISGVAQGGVAFARQAAAVLEVVSPTATLTGSVQDRGVDSNGNGLLDFIALDFGVNASVAGTYRLFVTLRTAGGQTLVRSSTSTIALGQQTATVAVDTHDLGKLGENGPYLIDQAELLFVTGASTSPADRLINLGQTAAYQLSQFERDAIALTGSTSDAGVDTNGNGLFDRLRISVGVAVLTGGSYQYSGRLTDVNGTPIDLFAGARTLVAGSNVIDFFFSGSKIGSLGVSGPYFLDNLLIFGAGKSLSVTSRVAQTQNYSYTQFENATRNPADLNNDGHVDCGDVAIVRASFGKRPGQPGFDPRADVNHDNVVDVRDLSTVTKALPIGLRC